MRKFLGLANPYHSQDEQSAPENRYFSWSWRPRRHRRNRRTKSCAERHPTPGPTDLPSTAETSPDRFSSLETPPNSPIALHSSSPIYPRSTDGTPKLMAPHPLSVCQSQILTRDWKARTWPYQEYDADDDEDDDDYDDAQDETGYEYPGHTTPTPTDQSPYASSVSRHFTYSSPPHKDREYRNQADVTSKNSSGNTTDKMVSHPLNHSNPEHSLSSHPNSSSPAKMMSVSTSGYGSPKSDLQPSDTESYQQGDFVKPIPHQVIHIWPRDTSDDPSYPAAVNCASNFKFRPPGKAWKPGRRYKQTKTNSAMPSKAAILEGESTLSLRAKLEQAEATITSLRRKLDQLQIRHLPSPVNSDDESEHALHRRNFHRKSHQKHAQRFSMFSEERIATGH